jgi:two-component system, chemotaxis family, sensor kinase Cph1
MPTEKVLDLGTCAREPIHVPGSIQPHGLLLVVDRVTDLILQAAGDAASLLDFRGSVTGKTVQMVLGISLAALIQRARAGLIHEPTYLGTVGPFGDRGRLNVTAHLVRESVIIEVEPATESGSVAETLSSIRSITEKIGGTSCLMEAYRLVADEVRHITGYDRVMVYQFLPDASGAVVAEAKDDCLSTFLNHRYPASDIPEQARNLYCRNAVRIIPNVNYTPAPLAPTLAAKTNQPLDMSYCTLRSVSPVHIQYLKNMGVGASMSVSILPHGELWGLIVCHNSKPRLVPYEAREACRHVGQVLSQLVRSQTEADNYQIERELSVARDDVMRVLIGADDPCECLLSVAPALQAIVPSYGIAVTRSEYTAITGNAPTETQVRQLAGWVQQRISSVGVFATDCLSEEYPEAKAFSSKASGVLATVLPADDPVTIMWFRPEQLEEINWAGNPHEPIDALSRLGTLNPRKSFATWRETVKGRSRPWAAVDIESVQRFVPRAAFVLQQQRLRELNHLLLLANEKLATLAATDGLTGLANRRTFDERLHKEWQRASRPPRRPLSMIILDLDFFKQYNDHYGHAKGDECLKQVAEVLEAGRRSSDLVARIGGEEFCILLPETDANGAMALAEIIRDRIEGLQLPHPKSHFGVVTASMGLAEAAAEESGTAQDMMRRADVALYEAKERGRNQIVCARHDV